MIKTDHVRARALLDTWLTEDAMTDIEAALIEALTAWVEYQPIRRRFCHTGAMNATQVTEAIAIERMLAQSKAALRAVKESHEQSPTLQGEAPTEPAPAAAVGLVDAAEPAEHQALCRELARAEALVLKVLVLNPLIDVVYRYVSEPAARDALEQAICDQAAVLAERLAVFAATLKQDEAKGA